MMHARFIDGIAAIAVDEWNAVAGTDYPFLRHEFLFALESSGSVCVARGWQPLHLLVEEDGRLIAVLPLYIKTHSFGEYVFDRAWAEAYRRHGLNYYPKLVSAIPFTPASGPRLAFVACDTSALMQTVAPALQKKCAEIGASGWHVLFPEEPVLPLWQQANSHVRLGCQFHWFNDRYKTFDDFLATFTARKRKELKRERRKVTGQGMRLQRYSGAQITEDVWQEFYRFYQATNLKYNGHGGYLTADLFARLHRVMADQMLLVMAYQQEDGAEKECAIAGALNFFSSDTLYGRYWGAVREVEFLHFEACYYQGIEFCIERGLQRFDPGAQGEHKIARGFRPVLTYSQHWIAQPDFRVAIFNFLDEEGVAVKQYRQQACAALPFNDDHQFGNG
jgi:predicted N-acyltransferase